MQQLFNNPNGRGGNEVRISFAKLYRIFHDRLEYMGANPDFDAVCQNACVEIEKAMGTFPNIPPLTSLPAPEAGVVAPAVKVKPLEWVRRPIFGGEDRVMSYDGYYWLSRTPSGFIVIGEDGIGHVQRLSGVVHPTEEAAKAAAQSHFESRILSAILPAAKPADAGVSNAMANLLRRIRSDRGHGSGFVSLFELGEIDALLSTAPAGDGVQGMDEPRAWEKFKLWFFRDMSDEQRLKLFSLFGMPIHEIENSHGHQHRALKHVSAMLTASNPREAGK